MGKTWMRKGLACLLALSLCLTLLPGAARAAEGGAGAARKNGQPNAGREPE